MILFLDFDGVLHPCDVFLKKGQPVLMADGHGLFEHAEKLAVMLEPHPHVQIVLSTSWVQAFGFELAMSYLPVALQERVVGSTFERVLEYNQQTRFGQISKYLDWHEQHHGPVEWVAIDDDRYGWPDQLRHRLVLTDEWFGLGEVNTQQALLAKLSGGPA
jgi:hypothetical protein